MRKLLPRLNQLFFISVLIAALGIGPRMLSLDSDLGRHLTLGKLILVTHKIPTRDVFSFTRNGDARPPYEWLTQVGFALADWLAGLEGVIFATGLLIAAAFALIYTDGTRRSGMPLAALAPSVLAVAASSLHWLPRPHVVTFLLLAIWLERLEQVRRGRRIPPWQFPALMVVWVNAHGGFIFGILAWIAYGAGWAWEYLCRSNTWQAGKRWIAIGAGTLAATIFTPGILGNWQAVLNNHSRYILLRTMETMPPDFSQAGTWPFLILLFLALALAWKTRQRFPAAHFFLLGGFALLGLSMGRNIPLFAVTAAPILAGSISVLQPETGRWKRIEANISALESSLRGAIWPVVFLIGCALFIGLPSRTPETNRLQFNAHVFPVEAVNWLESHPQPGNMFNEFNWGGYLLYRLWPGQKVFIDSQTDFYGESLMREYEQAITTRGDWASVLDKYNISWVILPVKAPLASALASTNWQIVYRDETAIILRSP